MIKILPILDRTSDACLLMYIYLHINIIEPLKHLRHWTTKVNTAIDWSVNGRLKHHFNDQTKITKDRVLTKSPYVDVVL